MNFIKLFHRLCSSMFKDELGELYYLADTIDYTLMNII